MLLAIKAKKQPPPCPPLLGEGGTGVMRGRMRKGPLSVIQDSSCALIAVVVVVLVDIRNRDAVGAGGVDELEVTVALNLCHNTYMVDAGGRAKEHQVAHMHVVAVVDGQSLLPLVATAATETNVERLIDKTGETGTVEGVGTHAATTVRPADIVLGLLDDLRTRNVEQGFQLRVLYLVGHDIGNHFLSVGRTVFRCASAGEDGSDCKSHKHGSDGYEFL